MRSRVFQILTALGSVCGNRPRGRASNGALGNFHPCWDAGGGISQLR